MAEGVKIEIVSPERLVLSEQARSVIVPGAEGYFTVLGDHAPLMTTLKPGFITVTDQANVAHVFYVRGGFADVAPTGLTILAEEARPVADFNRTEIEALIASGMTALEAATTAEEQDRLRTEIDQWKNLLLEAGTVGQTAH
ncbi:MAG: F0F1 ATP synthase subunit epsilon [Devosia sp.]|nr:F0F1 ATP synthase subunit epsilon [Devosia sp.]MBN9347087.1 F0F1 ATP synthase subunit epsilon [Devosia sp.]OJX46586.1 MAG: ATP synthase F1 subunit epsilon [Devosia sp. 66-22]